MDDLGSYVADDDLAIRPLSDLGITVETVSWRQTERAWSDFEMVAIRTPFAPSTQRAEFLAVLETIESQTRLENPLDIVRWNLNKRYLREMETRGARIVPTIWDAKYNAAEFDRWLNEFGVDEIIIKPTVSATALHTYRLKQYDASLEDVFSTREFLVQSFMPKVVSEGEYSLFYFNGEYSHAINKSPKINDFRVQEEHGGIITEIQPDESLLTVGRETVATIDHDLLYARVDFVSDGDGNFCLMELELIEPALYLRMNAGAPKRFAKAVLDRLRQ